jgi:hypothetical protein
VNVSLHARAQLLGRMPAKEAVGIITELEGAKAPKGSEARIIRRFGEQRSDGQSNGEVLLAIIEHETVVTCYWRRGTQTFSAEGFKVDRLIDMTRTEAEQAAMDRVATEKAAARLRKAWGAS